VVLLSVRCAEEVGIWEYRSTSARLTPTSTSYSEASLHTAAAEGPRSKDASHLWYITTEPSTGHRIQKASGA